MTRSTSGLRAAATGSIACCLALTLLLAGCSQNNDVENDDKSALAAIADDYIGASRVPYVSGVALNAGEISNLYSEPDEYRTVWMAYLGTTTGTEIIEDVRWNGTLDYLKDRLLSAASDGAPTSGRGGFNSWAEKLYLISELIPKDQITPQMTEAVSRAIDDEQDRLDGSSTAQMISDEAFLLRVQTHMGIEHHDPIAFGAKVLKSDLPAKARIGSLEDVRALVLASSALDQTGDVANLVRADLPEWLKLLTSLPLSMETAPILHHALALAESYDESVDVQLPGYDSQIAAFDGGWVGFQQASTPDPQLTFYFRSFGILANEIDSEAGLLPTGGWTHSTKPSMVGTGIAQLLQEQFDGAAPSGERLESQRMLVQNELTDNRNNLEAMLPASILAASARYRPDVAEVDLLTAAATTGIRDAAAAGDFLLAMQWVSLVENFSISAESLKLDISVNVHDLEFDSIIQEYAARSIQGLFGTPGTTQPSAEGDVVEFGGFDVQPGAIPASHPQSLTDIALVARVSGWTSDQKRDALASFIKTDTSTICAFSDCRAASFGSAEMLAASYLSRSETGSLPEPRLL